LLFVVGFYFISYIVRLSSRARAFTATVAEGFMDFTLWERPRMA
jgi:hypothetical protein